MAHAQHIVLTQQTQPFCFKWTIEKYSFLVQKNNITSEPFTTDGPRPRRWVMELYPRGDGSECSGHLSLFLTYCHDQADDEVTTSRKFTIKSATNNDYSSGPTVQVYDRKTNSITWGYPQFITTKMLEQRASDLIPNGTLTLICEGEILLEREGVKESTEGCGTGLSEDVQQYLKSVNRDVTLVADGFEIPVHQFILCARSPVFAAMFEHDTEEKRTGQVMIKDLQPEVVQSLVHFMYSDQAPEDMQIELAMKLLVAADKYQILRLKYSCELHLTECLTVEKVLGILELAMMHDSPRVKEGCLKFVKYNAEELKESQAWKECTNVEIMRILFDYCVM